MKKTSSFFSILLAIVLLFTSIGAVSADEPPPPLDGQTLPGPTLNYPTGGVLLYASGIVFNWSDVPGADKYVLELLRRDNTLEEYVNVIPPMTISSKTSPLPPTVAIVATKKPLPVSTVFRWRVTAYNTDVGADPAGSGQPSQWGGFQTYSSLYSIIDMFPGNYSGVIDYKKGDGTNNNVPMLNWVVDNGGTEKISPINTEAMIAFKITISQGRNKYTKTIPAATNCPNYNFGNPLDEDALCMTSLSDFTPPLPALEPKTIYNWEVVGVWGTDPNLVPNPAPIMAAMKDTLQYNTASSYPPLTNTVVTDTQYTNKPTFRWNQPAGGLAEGAKYQLVLEGYDTTKPNIVWKPVSAPLIAQGITKIPGTNTLACPANTDPCNWYFRTPLNPYYRYRWNVRILGSGKYYGPWGFPGTVGPEDDMVRQQTGADFVAHLVYDQKDGSFNYFQVPKKPNPPILITPRDKSIGSNSNVDLHWMSSSATNLFYIGGMQADIYTIDLTRLSPGPLTKTINVSKSRSAGEIVIDGGFLYTNTAALLPAEYSASGLPRGVYRLNIYPFMGPISGQPYAVSSPVKNSPFSFTIAPDAPTITGATYNPTTKKMSVTFDKDTSTPAASVKYRMLVKMAYGGKWRWVKIGTYAGTSCTEAGGASCTIEFFAYKPGTRNALESGEYRVNIQEALKDEGNTNPALNNKWGPFGQLTAGDGFSVTPW